jgi:hypothetical protein
MATSMGIESQMIEGRRVTDEESLRIVTMVYAGWINKSIVADLQASSCNALGLTGPDGGMVLSKKRAAEPIDYGFVGDIVSVNAAALSDLIAAGFSQRQNQLILSLFSRSKGMAAGFLESICQLILSGKRSNKEIAAGFSDK